MFTQSQKKGRRRGDWQWAVSCKSDTQTTVGWEHWNWTAQNKGVGKKIISSSVIHWNYFLLMAHSFQGMSLFRTTHLYHKGKVRKSITSAQSRSAFLPLLHKVFCLHFGYKEKWKKIKIKNIKQSVISALLLPPSDMLP